VAATVDEATSRVEVAFRITYPATMRRALHHVSSQPHLRVMAWLAWVMLALLPAHAMPVVMVMPVASMSVVMQHASARHHHATAPDCCADQLAATGCHCAASCVFTMPLVDAPTLAALSFNTRPAAFIVVRAPRLPRVPPLRPPLVQTPT
jgi:hypothetical protein